MSTAPVPADGAQASAGPRRSVRALAERGGLALAGLTLAALEGVLLAADARLGVAALELRHPGPHPVARERARDEDHQLSVAGDAAAAEREAVDREVDLLAAMKRLGHD